MPKRRQLPRLVVRSMCRAVLLYISAIALVFIASNISGSLYPPARTSPWRIAAFGVLGFGLLSVFVTLTLRQRRRWTDDALASSFLLCDRCGYPLQRTEKVPSVTCPECGTTQFIAETVRNWRYFAIQMGVFKRAGFRGTTASPAPPAPSSRSPASTAVSATAPDRSSRSRSAR